MLLQNKLENEAMNTEKNNIKEEKQQTRVLELMKQSLKEKNQQIEELSKNNKLLVYQIE